MSLAVVGCGPAPAPEAPPPTVALPPAGPASPAPGLRELSPEEAARVEVPRPDKEEEPPLPGPRVEITLGASGALIVNGKTVSRKERLVEFLRKAKDQHPDLSAIFFVDASVPYGRVIEVMDLVKQAGVERVQLAVDKAAPGP